MPWRHELPGRQAWYRGLQLAFAAFSSDRILCGFGRSIQSIPMQPCRKTLLGQLQNGGGTMQWFWATWQAMSRLSNRTASTPWTAMYGLQFEWGKFVFAALHHLVVHCAGCCLCA